MDEDLIVDALGEQERTDVDINLYAFATDVLGIDDPPGYLILCNLNPYETWHLEKFTIRASRTQR